MLIEHLNEQAINDGKLTAEQFDEWLWEYIDDNIVSNKFWNENSKFCQSVSFNAWHRYLNSNVSHHFICDIIKDMFINLFNNDLLDNSEYEN